MTISQGAKKLKISFQLNASLDLNFLHNAVIAIRIETTNQI